MMKRRAVTSTVAPRAVGPYSQAIIAGSFVFVSGQVAMDPASGQLVRGDVRAQTERTLENLKAVLEAAGSSLGHVVKTTVYLTSINDFAAMNEVYAHFFEGEPPARSTVAVAQLALKARVEIDVVAVLAEP